jgi:dTDP-4-dehydrorhamnose reductase
MMKVLVTGHTGMLGKEIVNVLLKVKGLELVGISRHSIEALPYQQIEQDFYNLDSTNSILNKIKPDVIIHAAALVNLKSCEENLHLADAIHVETTRILSSYYPKKTRFIYISTDSVFDGEKGNYTESDLPSPLNYYSKSKLEGEKVALRYNSNSVVLRTNIYGTHSPSGNSLLEWALNELKGKNDIVGFSDVIFNPLSTKQCAEIINYFICHPFSGILNLGVKKGISKYDFLCKVCDIWNFDQSLIKKGLCSDLNLKPVRPLNTTLELSKLFSIYNNELSLTLGLKGLKDD